MNLEKEILKQFRHYRKAEFFFFVFAIIFFLIGSLYEEKSFSYLASVFFGCMIGLEYRNGLETKFKNYVLENRLKIHQLEKKIKDCTTMEEFRKE